MYTPAAAAQSDNLLIWLVVALSITAVLLIAIIYTWMLLDQIARVRYGDNPEEIRRRHASHRPYSLPLNMVMIGASGTIICYLLQRMKPLLPAVWSDWICFLPLGVAILSALPVLGAIRALRRALRVR